MLLQSVTEGADSADISVVLYLLADILNRFNSTESKEQNEFIDASLAYTFISAWD